MLKPQTEFRFDVFGGGSEVGRHLEPEGKATEDAPLENKMKEMRPESKRSRRTGLPAPPLEGWPELRTMWQTLA